MSHQQQRGDQTNDPQRPSQAEGARDTVEQSLREKQGQGRAKSRGSPQRGDDRTNDPPRPSQAEGEREATRDHRDKQR